MNNPVLILLESAMMFCMIDLCIDARMAFCSGIGVYIRQLVPFFNAAPFRLRLLVDRFDQPWCCGIEQILFRAPIYSVKEQLQYPLKVPKCDLFWSPHYNVPLLPIRAKKRIATIHDACHLALGTFEKKMYAKWVMRRALARSDRAITVSQFSKVEIEKFVGCGDLKVIHVGINRNTFSRKPSSEEIRKKYRLPERFVLFIGNFKPHKNIERLIRAFSKVNVSGLELVVVGKGTALGQVLDEELPVLYSMAEMFVFPSLYEGFGLPPLEAMSCGCPTVVSNAASIPEVCGDASVYFNPENVDEMADAIRRVAVDEKLRAKLIQRGLERVEVFKWEKTAMEHRKVFEEVCFA
ncbi:MAG: glycosyltransferase family 1 protein [Chlamydiae bacterium CG10_big_fil_rev_8_21_14_0_10_42_34]|nr:MAG: glycosyltransferase family 1 protein [Chlamydiae bacterium CG10_big_fil_rev_8_21_14_0_10_42_34]